MGTSATAATGFRRSSSAAFRDRELLTFVGRHGAVSIEHVMAALGVGSTMAYRRVAACAERVLISRVAPLRDEPSLLVATREGLRYAGLGLPVAVVSPGSVGHWLRCASAALSLGEGYGHERVVSERELRFAEQWAGRPIASAKIGELPSGRPRLHRPDLVLLPEGIERIEDIRAAPPRSSCQPRSRSSSRRRRPDDLSRSCAPGDGRTGSPRSATSALPGRPGGRSSG